MSYNDGQITTTAGAGALVQVEAARGIAEVHASLQLAKAYPRDEARAVQRIEVACQRPRLAEVSLYSYSRGGADVTGPSVRLAEALAQNWGNLDFGVREVSQSRRSDGIGESTVQAYCWDKETNTRREVTFQVPHVRDTKAGRKPLTDARDIYEAVANQGARRMRACILGIIPGDVVEHAVNVCRTTLETHVDMSPKAVNALLEGFKRYGVSRKQIEAWLARSIEAMTRIAFASVGCLCLRPQARWRML